MNAISFIAKCLHIQVYACFYCCYLHFSSGDMCTEASDERKPIPLMDYVLNVVSTRHQASQLLTTCHILSFTDPNYSRLLVVNR